MKVPSGNPAAESDTAAQPRTAGETERDTLVAEVARLRAGYEALLGPLADAILNRRRLEGEIAAAYNSRGWRAGRKLVSLHDRALRVFRVPLRILSVPRRVVRALLNIRELSRRVVRALLNIRELPRRVLRIVRRLVRYTLRLPKFGLNRCFGLVTRAASWRRLHLGRPRTMWGVTPILTLPLLARCDRLLGLRSDSLVFTTYYITNSFDINLKRLCERVYAKYPRLTTPLHHAILRWALIRYDVFHLFCDRSLLLPTRRMELNEQEMRAMRHHGRRLYTYTYGADVRTREATLALGRYNLCADCPEPGRFCMCDDTEGSANISRISTSATAMMAMGDMLSYVPGARNFHFWPLDVAAMRYVGTRWSKGQTLRIAHAPNHPHFKGTHHLVDAIERLQGEGRAIELVRVQGVPNNEVIALFESCDLVADQFIAGFHGYTALEAMAVGKPVLCYLRDPSMTIDAAVCPMINTWPDTIYQTLRDCLDGCFDLAELGRRSRAYVEHYYSLEAVALRLGALYLETAGFPERINLRMRKRMALLEAGLTPVLPGPLPVSWDSVADIDERVEQVA